MGYFLLLFLILIAISLYVFIRSRTTVNDSITPSFEWQGSYTLEQKGNKRLVIKRNGKEIGQISLPMIRVTYWKLRFEGEIYQRGRTIEHGKYALVEVKKGNSLFGYIGWDEDRLKRRAVLPGFYTPILDDFCFFDVNKSKILEARRSIGFSGLADLWNQKID